MTEFVGQRLPDGSTWFNAPNGSYVKTEHGWFCKTPNGHAGNLNAHDVVEHEDGTITVSPSILVSNPQEGQLWHGFLRAGVWSEA